MRLFYTARGCFSEREGVNWVKYIDFSKLYQVRELVSLDSMLNELVVQADLQNPRTWDYVVTDGKYFTSLFTDLQFVLSNTPAQLPLNLLLVTKDPAIPCESLVMEGYEFIGYDLLDKSYDISALTNCGGFENVFDNAELNQYGLISDFDRAVEVNEVLLERNPEEYHADCNMFGIWRHLKLGKR